MFSNKENISILTSLLWLHGVKKAVVCPGSRNAAIVHNLNESTWIKCYPVTDERSAGFYALGMIQASGDPVAVCVTSGTALLNLAPVVAEAMYQHLPLVVISADRPQAWIGQQDGQTLEQSGALGRYVKYSVSLPEPRDDDEHWYCNRLINEALINMQKDGGGPIHINVPVSEPLFEFTAEGHPFERQISYVPPMIDIEKVSKKMIKGFFEAIRPMIVIGQLSYRDDAEPLLEMLGQYAVTIREPLSPFGIVVPFDEVLHKVGPDPDYMPDFILYLGGTLVSKRIKNFLRKAIDAECWTVSVDGDLHDTFMNLTGAIQADPYEMLKIMGKALMDGGRTEYIEDSKLLLCASHDYRMLWINELESATDNVQNYLPAYSEMMAVKEFEHILANCVEYNYQVHYANSMAVRLGNIYANHYIYVNRGVNGIEGSMSTAAGFSLVSDDIVFCVIGDLSFFYDQNALWNQNLGANFRILLLNNHGGGIFHQLKGIKDSPVCKTMVSARHEVNARGICEANNIDYLCAYDGNDMERKMYHFLTTETERPLLFEVFTDPDEDTKAYEKYYQQLLIKEL